MSRLRALFRRRGRDDELAEELAFHVEQREEALKREGLSAPEARRRARIAFGSTDAASEAVRDTWRSRTLHSAWRNLRLAARTLAKRPAMTASAVLALSLGIGASVTVFTILNAVILRPLPFANAERLFEMRQVNPKLIYGFQTAAAIEQVERIQTAESIESVSHSVPERRFLSGAAEPDVLFGARVSAGFLDTLGVTPRLGRGFAPDDFERDDHVVLLTDWLWRRRFAADPAVIGREMRLDDEWHTVIGILPPEVRYPLHQTQVPGIQNGYFRPLSGRPQAVTPLIEIRPDVTAAQAESELAALLLEERSDWTIELLPLDRFLDDVRRPLWLVFAATVLVLLIACANVGALLLARSVTLDRESAIRVALGAGRLQIAAQQLAESALLSLAGASLGVAIAAYTVPALLARFPAYIPRAAEASIDARVVLFTAAVALFAACSAAALPALRVSRTRLYLATSQVVRLRSLDAVVVAQTALAVVLLVGSGLFLRSLDRILAVDLGFAPARVLTFRLTLPERRYADWSAAKAFHSRVLESVAALPGVQTASLSYLLPFSGRSTQGVLDYQGAPPRAPDSEGVKAESNIVTPGYFATVGQPLLSGRVFQPLDRSGAPPVAIVSRSTATTLWPGSDPMGKRIRFARSGPDRQWRTVVGVVEDVKHWDILGTPMPKVYIPYAQADQEWTRDMLQLLSFVSIRTAADPRILTQAVRQSVSALDSEQPIRELRGLEDIVQASLATERLESLLLTSLALVGLTLAALGIYSVLAYAVSRRTREIGVRMALGAAKERVVRHITARTAALGVAGVTVGVIIAVALARLVELNLHEVSPLDPSTYLAAALALFLAAAVAGVVPARRAVSVRPSEALRHE